MPKWFLVKRRNKELSADDVTLDQHAATYRMDDGVTLDQHAATYRMDDSVTLYQHAATYRMDDGVTLDQHAATYRMDDGVPICQHAATCRMDEKPDLQVSIDSASLPMTSSPADSGYSHSPSETGVTENDVTSQRPNENKDVNDQSRESSPILGGFQDFQPLDLSTTGKSHPKATNQDTEIPKTPDTSCSSNQSENDSPRISNQSENSSLRISNQSENGSPRISSQPENGSPRIRTQSENGSPRISNQSENGSPRISNQSENGSPRINPNNNLLFANIFLDRGCYPFQLPVRLSNRLPIHPPPEVLVPTEQKNRIPFVGGDRSEVVGPIERIPFDISPDIVGPPAPRATTKRKRTHSSSQDPAKETSVGPWQASAGNWEEGGIFSREAEMTPEAKAELENIPNKLGEYVCKLCFKLHKDAFELAKHSCSQIARIEYKCVDCSKKFNCPANLASHRRWHRPKSVI